MTNNNLIGTVLASLAVSLIVSVRLGEQSLVKRQELTQLIEREQATSRALGRALERCRTEKAILQCEQAGLDSCKERVAEMNRKAAEFVKKLEEANRGERWNSKP